MRRAVAILLALLFCFLAYLEVVAQEISADVVVMESTTDSNRADVAGPDISQSIDYGLQIICESEGGEFKFVKNIPKCEKLELESGYK